MTNETVNACGAVPKYKCTRLPSRSAVVTVPSTIFSSPTKRGATLGSIDASAAAARRGREKGTSSSVAVKPATTGAALRRDDFRAAWWFAGGIAALMRRSQLELAFLHVWLGALRRCQ